MKKISRILLTSAVLSLLSLSFHSTLFAYWVWSPEAGKFINSEETIQGTAEEQYNYAMEFYKKKDFKEAGKQFRLLLKAYPASQAASEAQFRLGVVQEELGDYNRAFRAYRDLLQKYPSSDRVAEAVKREFRIGNLFLSGRKAKVLGLEILPSGPKAVEVFKHLVATAPFSEWGDKAQFQLGLAYKKINQFDEALDAFQGVIDRYPESKLVPQARFQIADTAYLQSVALTRDQKVIDRASEEIDRFLTHYPDSGVSDKAAKLRQEIDEKNAEKNYRIALFYENENFLDSAFVYYRDVSSRYPHTQWGEKALKRLEALEKPAEYLKAQEAEIVSRKAELLKKMGSSADEAQKKEWDWQLKRLEKEQKEVGHSKEETLKRRRSGLKQKEAELREGRKALKAKKKRFAKNPSEDLEAAFKRWEESLAKEEARLVQEKMMIGKWEESLGVSTEPFYSGLIPFGKEAPTPLEQVRKVEAKRLGELARANKELLEKKEGLYREYEKLLTLEGALAGGEEGLVAGRSKLDSLRSEVDSLERQLKEKEEIYESQFGRSALARVFRAPQTLLERSVDVLNPFEGDPTKGWSSKSPEELKSLESHWREKAAAQKVLVDTIAQAFDEELAVAEEKRLLSKVEEKESDPAGLRRSIKQLEREIRGRYSEIQDRNARKNELLEKLEQTLQGKSGEKTGGGKKGGVLSPVSGAYKLGKAFFFGLPERDVTLTKEAEQLQTTGTKGAPAGQEVKALREEIELESVLIETRNQEIQRFERELDALQARASLSGAPPIRSLLVKFPYVFVREAIVSARRLVPEENRREKLIEQLNRETDELRRLNQELAKLEDLIAKKSTGTAVPKRKKAVPVTAASQEPVTIGKAVDSAALQGEIRSLEKQLQVKRESFESERERFESARWEKLSESRGKARTEQIRELEEKLAELIEEENKIHEEESGLLTKKKEVVEQLLSQFPKDLFGKDLDLEKEEIEGRLNQLQKRESALGEEIKRLRPQAFPPSA